jgi:hypothetical protein
MVIDFLKGKSYSFHCTFVFSEIMHYIDRSMIKGMMKISGFREQPLAREHVSDCCVGVVDCFV